MERIPGEVNIEADSFSRLAETPSDQVESALELQSLELSASKEEHTISKANFEKISCYEDMAVERIY